MDPHTIFIVSVVVIIAIFVIMLLATITLCSEKFTSVNTEDDKDFERYRDPDFEGTSLVEITDFLTRRHPIAIETPTNWYSTQPVVSRKTVLGTDMGKTEGGCIC